MDMNTFSLLVFHIAFIAGLYWYAHDQGKKDGRSEMVGDLLDRKLLTVDNIKKEYEIHP